MTKGRIFLLFGAGILAGGGVAAIVMNQVYQQPPVEKKTTPKSEETSELKSEKKESKFIPVESTALYIDKKLPIRIKGDTTKDYYKNIEENSAVYDSLLSQNSSSEVNINRDQMIESLKVRVKYLPTESRSPEDSLLNKMNSIKSGNKPSSIEVEVWESPIHYKGYKLGRNKLVVYGIDPSQDILLFDLNDYVLLQSGSMYYRLEKTSEFKNLKKFTDQAVISRLK